MSQRHLHYIGEGLVASYRIAPRRQDEDPDIQNTNERPDYTGQKQSYREDLQKFNIDIARTTQEKKQLIDDHVFEEDLVTEFQEHYLVIDIFGRVPKFFLKSLKGLYNSVEFKYYANFNRQIIVNINQGDLELFIRDMDSVATYDADGPNFIPDHKFKAFKLIKNFSYYALGDRLQINTYNKNSFLLQFFQISNGKREQIISVFGDNFLFEEVTPSVYKLSIQAGAEENNYNQILSKYVSVFDDIQTIQPGFVDVIIDPNIGTVERSELSLGGYDITKLPKVGIIDSGISENRTIINNLLDKPISRSFVDGVPFTDSKDHGTGVASLVIFGEQLNNGETILTPHAQVISLKIFSATGCILAGDMLKGLIEEYYTNGVRVFNMSINLKCNKEDNQNHDLITYILDYTLADSRYRNVLFFISAGNVMPDQMATLMAQYSGSANFKFDEGTNICTPADSTNAVSVGSLDNSGSVSEFSRKNCLDYGTPLTKKRSGGDVKITTDIAFRSPYGYKPDFVFLGEDIKMLSSDFTNEARSNSGTSFSSPLICNIACRLISIYPRLSANAIKSLLLNNGNVRGANLNIDQHDGINLPAEIKSRNQLLRGSQRGSDTNIQNREMELLKQRYIGFGKVNLDKVLYSESNKATIIIEDTIKLNHENIYEINIPNGQDIFSGNGSIKLIGSLSYNHIPILSDHLNYNPIHIAYRILACSAAELKEVTDKIKESEKKLLDLTEDTAEYEEELGRKTIYEKQKDGYVIDIGGKGRSHDNYYRVQYSNNQTQGNDKKIRKTTLRQKVNQKLFVEIRCNIKTLDVDTNIFHEIRDFIWYTQQKIVDNIDDVNRYFDQFFAFCLTIEDESGSGIDIYQSLVNANVGVLAVVEAEDLVQEAETLVVEEEMAQEVILEV